MRIDMKKVAFSAAGAYLCVSEITKQVWGAQAEDGLWIRLAHGTAAADGVLARIEVVRGEKPVAFAWEATPWRLQVIAGDGRIHMAFDDDGRLQMRGEGISARLAMPAGVGEEFLRYGDGMWDINCPRCRGRLMLRAAEGEIELYDPGVEESGLSKVIEMSGERWGLAIEDYVQSFAERPVRFDVDHWADWQQARFEGYAQRFAADVPEPFQEAARAAAYVNLSATVRARGCYETDVMLMSKNWMRQVWTWDSAFNAVACAGYDDEMAWNNFAAPFRRQHQGGRLPDSVNEYTWIDCYTKPPIHGWALSKLREAGVLTEARREWIYPRLWKWAQSWYDTMDWDHDGMCQYNHGNDSGWDNCTNFKCGAPVEGPDLAAYLVLCWDELAVLAREMGRDDESAAHAQRAEQQLSALLEHSWDGERFRVLHSGTHIEQQGVDSLFPFLPILLGDRLPSEVFAKLAAGLRRGGRFRTPHGLATESIMSPWYVNDGYWRGPIWAPPTMFIVEGLRKGGEADFAAELAEDFCTTCARGGFAENFDAHTGAGLRDRAYTWTSSVFLILARGYLQA